MLITANFKKKIFSFFSKCNHNSERITEAYDRIERLEYRSRIRKSNQRIKK